jgi:hypothetical protein
MYSLVPPVEELVVRFHRNGARSNLKMIHDGVVEVTITEIDIGFIPRTNTGQGNTELEMEKH